MSDARFLVAPCGIYCGECIVYKSKDNPELQKSLIDKGLEPSSVPCPGCRAIKGNSPALKGATCENYQCSIDKEIAYCSDCADFPCYKLCPCADRADVLPHNTKIFNLCMIKEKGLENFLKEAGSIQVHYFKGKMIVGKGPQLK